jgi:cation transport regulator ChaC
MALVFQYGSNCSDSQINDHTRLRGDGVFAGIAETLNDYQLAFNVHSVNRGCAACDIVSTPGSKVWGVLYEVPDWLMDRETARARDRKSFDAIEGEGSNYRRTEIEVRRSDGLVLFATTYVVSHPQSGLRTNLEYVSHIIVGLRERGVNSGYIDKVKLIATANAPEIAEGVVNL